VTVTGAEDYARMVREMADRRELIRAIGTAIGEAYSGNESAGDIVARLQRQIGGIGCAASRLNPRTAAEFLALDLPSREMILDPWLPRQGLVMIHSMRGIGKTHLALSLGYAVACGAGLLGWEAPAPRRVIYLDGEMPAVAMQRRLAAVVAGFDPEPSAPDYFRLLCADETPNGLPDLATAEGQREIDAVIGKAELIVVDNLSCLVRSGKENEGESWLPVQGWALAHRRAGRSVLFAHHSGKGGLQRGTSRREDVLDTVLGLRRPSDYTPDQGARFEVVFEKARGLYGDAAQSFEARYEERDDAAVWTRTEIADAELLSVVEALRDGMSIRETAQELGIHRSKVERLKKRAVEKGMLGDREAADD
jgi:putative DNA primase/helicase